MGCSSFFATVLEGFVLENDFEHPLQKNELHPSDAYHIFCSANVLYFKSNCILLIKLATPIVQIFPWPLILSCSFLSCIDFYKTLSRNEEIVMRREIVILVENFE